MENLQSLIIAISYLVSASLFIMGIQKLGSPATARNGNLLASLGMLIAIVATMFDSGVLNYTQIIAGLVIGAGLGAFAAKKVEMTSMPQLVALFNGFGGAASGLVALGEFYRILEIGDAIPAVTNVTISLSLLIGGVTLTGSLMAFGKLQGIIGGNPITFPGQKIFNGLVFLTYVAGSYMLLTNDPTNAMILALTGISLAIGIFLVMPIGGADMPVVISLLNSFSGVAAGLAGFVVNNNLLIIAGALVGASGLILTQIMCKGMNRTLGNVIFGAFGQEGAVAATGSGEQKSAKSLGAEEAAMMLGYAGSVVVVPGYGMAVAQAQHAVREMGSILEGKGVEVKYAIHPVAGRMPGHMNVLLAEANVPYTQLYDMDDINSSFPQTDVALVIGANDVVNPAAKNDPASPIAGMPILEVDQARSCIVIKRSLSSGFAGIDNELFYADKTQMLFGSAKEMVGSIVNELKEL